MKLAKEFPYFENEIGKEETIKLIRNMVDFMGSVPRTPNILLNINEKDDIAYMCSRDKMSNVLNELSIEYKNKYLKEASDLFYNSGLEFEKLCKIFINYLLDDIEYKNNTSKILLNIAKLEYNAYELVLKGIKDI